ncbi:hypothetical protein QJS04_geneDACA020241 [Acorus gramineus]|uniref:Neprosin PEP catalytic domain-containing protein n=1 Tax=Acorus gramineus TaxID=55184 RepID=A0AAV9A417_ACOGR|nr:hypothetical protein QJS04_geneDACA020241 [Acorus gramineus]
MEQVHPQLNGDSKTRLFSHWTADNYHSTGCYNLLYPEGVEARRGAGYSGSSGNREDGGLCGWMKSLGSSLITVFRA